MPPQPSFEINHLTLPSSSPAALAEWYVNILGFSRVGDMLASGDFRMKIVQGVGISLESECLFGFRVASRAEFQSWTKYLEDRGLHLASTPSSGSPPASAMLRDLDGNTLELYFDPT